MGFDWAISTMPYGPTLQKCRMLLHQFLSRNVMEHHHNNIVLETHQLVLGLIDSLDNYFNHMRRYSSIHHSQANSLQINVNSLGDHYIKLTDDKSKALTIAGEPGAFFVNFIPSLQYIPEWFPGAGFKHKAREWCKLCQAMLNDPYKMTKHKILEGTTHSSMTSDLIELYTTRDGVIDSKDDIVASATILYAASSNTSVATITSFILALVLYPEVQTRRQEELDCVIRTGWLPTFDDQPNLPYIECIVKETLRYVRFQSKRPS
ncbi:hypothetical protein PILCRDRAFT_65238 [Piloderma croceum F 1598]|uniref:Cytochrome P450 n=1 Tax=Piloderma croceum (strain F 1598) TaxID=765440 RepID=A0A0C3BJ55_PILCF|nr:hypothetical protein PILCRDRAFT_65238 [Piloderma croceum F 1598]